MLKLLIVEDNKPFLDTLIIVFKKTYSIDTAMSYTSAINLLEKNNYDIVITDGAFPDRDGQEVGNHGHLSEEDYRGSNVAEYAKSKNIPVIGISMEPKRLKNCDIVFPKAVDLTELRKVMEDLVSKNK